MNTVDLSPLYRNSIGFDRFGSLLDSVLHGEQISSSYPPYNIEVTGENEYSISLAVAGFAKNELDIQVDRGVLSIRGRKEKRSEPSNFLHRGIAFRTFERKFDLAEHIKVVGAELNDGLLSLTLVKEIPEQLRPRSITIGDGSKDQKINLTDSSNESVAEA